MINIGTFQTLTILRLTTPGLFLGDDEDNDILLPNIYIPETYEIGDEIEVFIYTDSEDRPIATTLKPICQINEFAFLKVKQTSSPGAFLDLGLAKDLLVPKSQQAFDLYPDQTVLVYVYLDTISNRIVGSTKWRGFIKPELETFEENQAVKALLYEETDLGFKAIINNKSLGMLYKNEIFDRVKPGDLLDAFVSKIREDYKLDLRLVGNGYDAQIDKNTQIVLEALQINNGFLRLTDKSDPKEIIALLGMSKKSFKKTVGSLYRRHKIEMEADGIKLVG
jgi:predicted RNA-binding protein (virulence factor B family)